ncbi:alpha/beta fold hydrolase [Enterobacter oligotrophicus]|uniref:alpha/beta fold hydrolase n=1 Tax=Enterobacter oligotrophicus TaxID=2478464 RepID=UPI001260FCF6|nr:alpha/beta hydrolase [Enterobacter oligotrophicus]
MNASFIDNSDVPLVLIGGTLCNARLWQPLIAQLNVPAVICLTLSCADSAQESSRRLLNVLPPRFLLAGFSLGAIVALQMVADAPERLAGLALLSVNPLADRPENAATRRAAVRNAREQGHGKWLSSTLWHQYVAPSSLDNQELHDVLCLMAQETDSAVFARQTEIAIGRRDNRAALSALLCPVLIMNGEHDPVCTPAHHQLAAASAAHATWITLSSTGHFFILESAENAAVPLRKWITESLNASQ